MCLTDIVQKYLTLMILEAVGREIPREVDMQDRPLSIQVGLLLFSVFIVMSDSSLRETDIFRSYYSNNRTIMNIEEKKNPVLGGKQKQLVDYCNFHKHTYKKQHISEKEMSWGTAIPIYASSEHSEQTAHPHSLIIAFAMYCAFYV